MSKKVFIASKYMLGKSIRQYMFDLEKKGYEITYDWTAYYMSGIPLLTTNVQDNREIAQKMKQAIINCDIFIGVFEVRSWYMDAFVELGMAIMLGKEIFLIGPKIPKKSLFSYLPGIHFYKSWDLFKERYLR